MRNLGITVALVLAGCGGKAASGDDCATAIDKAYLVSKPEVARLGVDDATQAKMKAVTLAHCTNDKWDAGVVGCLAAAKTYDDMLKCTDALKQDQKAAWTGELAALLPKPTPTPTPTPTPAGSGSAAGSGTGTGTGSAKGAMNGPCKDLGDLVAKTSACTKLPKAARDAYAQAYDHLVASADLCKATADAIRESAATTCGW